MGRIKTSFVKNVAQQLFERYGDRFTTSFEENKKLVKELCEIKSKRLRNMIAGYITALKRRSV